MNTKLSVSKALLILLWLHVVETVAVFLVLTVQASVVKAIPLQAWTGP